jgi:hypothetical protein
MRGITTYGAILALLLAVVYAPMFHLHADDHDGGTPFIHAHFPELFHHEDESGPAVEEQHDHVYARQIDVLTTNIAPPVQVAFYAVEETFAPRPVETSPGFVILDDPRAHDPPSLRSSNPRSPPL